MQRLSNLFMIILTLGMLVSITGCTSAPTATPNETPPTTTVAPTEAVIVPNQETTPTETVDMAPTKTMTPTLIPTPEAVMVEIPNVIGMTKEEAETALKEVSDKFIVNFEEEYSSEQEEGLIFAQNATGMVSEEETLTLTISLGVRMVEIPSVYAKKPDVAEQTLQKKGFVTSFEYEYANELKDHVSRTEPAKKELVEYGSKVIIYISKGLEPTPSPTPNPNPSPTPIPVSKLQPNGEVLCSYQIGDNVTGTLYSNMVYVVSGKGATYDYGNPPQNKRGEMLEYNVKVQKIIVEEGVTVIGDWALAYFYDCKEVVLPKSLVEIKERGFARVGQMGFEDIITGKLNKNAWYTKINLEDTSLVKLGDVAFEKGTIAKLNYPETIEYIGMSGEYCGSRTVIIPASVRYYNGDYFFDKTIIKGKDSIDDFEFFTYAPRELIAEYESLGYVHFIFEP